MIRPLRSVKSVTPMQATCSLKIPSDIRTSKDGTGMTILDIGRARLFKCNLASADIWSRLAAHQSPAEIAAELSRQYHMSAAEMQQHVFSFVNRLMTFGLVFDDQGNGA